MTKHEYVIGRFRLQPGRGLLADGAPVPIGSKALDILSMLVAAEGGVVSKDELMERVWPGMVVEEHNIQVHVSALRKALGRDGDWIRTVPRLGYRFVGPVTAARTTGATLPRPLSRLFGREDDVATIRQLFDRARLVTLVGPGGIGKTRLGIEIGRMMGERYREGVIFADLSALQDASQVAPLVAAALGIELKGVALPAERLARQLKPLELLLLLDNCEHVVEAVAPLAELILAEAPSMSLLATSREPLACTGEQVYRLPLLPVPAEPVRSAREALAAPAVALLVDRLRAADQRFELSDATAEAAGAICRRLDGLPLAIEMVGALVPGLGLAAVAARLEESFRLPHNVTRTAPPRHRSLEATLDWSYALLSPLERTVLRRLAVFPGHFSLEAAEAVIADETLPRARCGDELAGLVRKSLVSIDPDATRSPYRLLETIRSYAVEKLEAAGELTVLRARHARYLAEVLGRAMREFETTADTIGFDRYGGLLDDLRAALRWSFGPDGDVELGLAIVGRSRLLWALPNLRREGRCQAEEAAARLRPETPDSIAAYVWMAVGALTGGSSFERSIVALRTAAELFGRLNDRDERGTALAWLGQMLALSGQPEAAAEVLTEARVLLDGTARKRRLGDCALGFGLLHTATGSWAKARRECEAAVAWYREADSPRQVVAALHDLTDAIWAEGELVRAIETEREVLDLARRDRSAIS
ncbi:MAG: winged helix-turn-helix domain-containing protein [Aliidongia sp.]